MSVRMMPQTRELQQSSRGHIFYEYQNVEKYIQNTVSYILAGIEEGDNVIVIENDYLFPKVLNELNKELSSNDLAKVHRVNNFDFYCFKGDFNSKTVISYFKEYVEPFLDNQVSVRTWAHVEWSNQDQITYYVGEYEKEVDQTVVELGLTTVCAYHAARVPIHLRKTLLTCHRHYMTDDGLHSISDMESILALATAIQNTAQ